MSITDVPLSAVITRALYAATRAPSVHNTQPWRFTVAPALVEVHLDRERLLPVADPDGREARMSCGAAVFNLRAALHAVGWGAVVELVPDRERPDLLAVVRFTGRYSPTSEQLALASAIDRRSTSRRPFTDQSIPPSDQLALSRAAEGEQAHLVLLETPDALDTLATLSRRADHTQEEDPEFQRELLKWTEYGDDREDGVPRNAGGPRPIGGAQLALRRFPADASERTFEQDALVAILATHGDSPLEHVRAGMALQAVLLTATVAGLSTSFLSQPVEVPQTRTALRSLLPEPGHPQTVLCIGYGHPAAPTRRRPVTAVTTNREE